MKLKIVVLAKQVPDTRNVGKDAMTAEGTVNRAALPAIFNPEDLNALEQALRIKDQNPGSTVGILTMGPPRAGEIIRQGLYRGADTGWLLTDRLFAGADTLATSYALSLGIRKIGDVDIVIGGRQAIDGDTAQVGPQVAQKLGLNQVTYAEEIIKIDNKKATIRRHIDGGVETVEAPLPLLVTVNGTAAPCRPCNAKLVMKYKYASCPMERKGDEPWTELYKTRPYLTLNQWSVADVAGDPQQCGLSGSPTKVKAVQNIVFHTKESKRLTSSDEDIDQLMKELISEKIIG
ncbi:MAG: electron transfer flavoprotein subunit beta/FixA family protein [Prevotella sp.]|jgi:electron transfer flavoprotein beta subunit|nr:electron transfer flavoprotein subunit beta/FixA family protein [Prevotella sp.]MCH3985313.1 electron transfer flavoprotein subunit beta/FixA family protein [Prevotella sp.]MCH3992327.1 electron transfer flavoprotein subunit beta/FixA family protein [Prevotella sp.]MCH4017087.1 electron transfer flavoprotein subunit beta/FixA family protein [Prevotella sp.]MCH4099992.1 electron transfer flavoprotein subunit beta/FixA family protein [Prevotella sp.]MCH4250722.1 electron transfer flavoprotein